MSTRIEVPVSSVTVRVKDITGKTYDVAFPETVGTLIVTTEEEFYRTFTSIELNASVTAASDGTTHTLTEVMT